MKSLTIATILSFALLLTPFAPAGAGETCERTIGSSKEFVETWPKADTWFGNRALAVLLPENGLWPTTSPGHSLGAWTMLTGIDFPSAGCWEVSGTYMGDTLTFIVETIEHDKYRRDAT